MKLTASPHFPEKRIGYLGMMLLLSEEADVLMLATNALKNDLNSENKFVCGLSLCAIGNLATSDMSRDLAPEVDKQLKSSLGYLRKKACLAMSRCLSKCPDMVEDFIERVVGLLKDRNQGVLVTVIQLMTQILMIDYRNALEEGEDPYGTPCRGAFLRLVPTLVKMLRNLISSGFSADRDVAGVSDPFLQVQLLTLLRLLGVNNEEASEEMNDVLAQVASNTETVKNAGYAVQYECVQTIMGIPSEDGLRVLAVNILGRFLLNRDNNVRYVALNTLARCIVEQKQSGESDLVVSDDTGEDATNAMAALQRHRTTVVDCLKDPDVSIRQRALELIYHLVNEENVESLTAELLNYLVLCPREHRRDICTRVLKVVDRYSPDDRWRVDTLITTLTIAGRESSADVQSATVLYISRASADVHAFCAHKLLKAVRDDDGSQHGLLAVGVWCIGEYGEMLLQNYQYTPNSVDGEIQPQVTFMALLPDEVVTAVERVMNRVACPEFVQQRALTAFVKLSQRFAADPSVSGRLEKLLEKHQASRSLELQLRSCEYNALLHATKGMSMPKFKKPALVGTEADLFDMGGTSSEGDSTPVSAAVVSAAKEALARMPVVDIKVLQKRLSTDEFGSDDPVQRAPRARTAPKATAPSGGGDLLDLADVFGAAPPAPAQNGGLSQPGATAPASGGGQSDIDLLTDIFSAQPAAPAGGTGGYDPFSTPTTNAPAPAVNPMDLFGAPTNQPSTSAPLQSMDPFGAGPIATPAQPIAPATSDPFGATPANPVAGDIFGAAPPTVSTGIRVAGVSHAGLSVEFECSKPEPMNNQKSTLLAQFTNSTGGPIHGLNMQVAVPKFITLEMEPPSATTIPNGSSSVTQKVTVTNSMMGTKNLVLKVKLSFSSNGQKVEHMATCSGFPAGQF